MDRRVRVVRYLSLFHLKREAWVLLLSIDSSAIRVRRGKATGALRVRLLGPSGCCGFADKKEVFRAWLRGTIVDSKWTLYGPEKSMLISKEELFLALKENPPKANWKENLTASDLPALFPPFILEKKRKKRRAPPYMC